MRGFRLLSCRPGESVGNAEGNAIFRRKKMLLASALS